MPGHPPFSADSASPPRPGARLELVIDDLGAEGQGVGRVGGWVVFVPGAVPGDRVAARATHRRRGFVEATLEQVLEPAATRRHPPCPHQATCGGCPLMVLDEASALGLKVRHLEQALARLARIEIKVRRAIPSPAALRYRGRVRFAVAPRERGARLGFHPRGVGDELVPIDDCRLAPPRLSELGLDIVRRLRARRSPTPRPWLTQLELRHSFAERAVLAVLHTPPGRWPEAASVAKEALSQHEDLVGVWRVIDRPGLRQAAERLGGVDVVRETIAGLTVELSATSFLQVNPAAAAELYGIARQWFTDVGRPRRVLDLFCGVGLLGLLTTREGDELVGVERLPDSVERARRAAEMAGRTGVTFVAADALAYARALHGQGQRFDALSANPPRAGLGKELAAAIADLAPADVLLVSCHPATLARDAALLVARGYRVVDLVAVDMFPQTPHLEAIARLTRAPE